MEYVAKGITNNKELASLLNTSPATVSRDFLFVAKAASKNLHNWTDKMLPLSVKCLSVSTDMIMRKAWKLLEKSEHKDGLDERKHQLEILQFIAALNGLKRNFMVDYENVVLQLTSHRAVPLD